eukprot:scaffold2.g7243.t1
MSYQRDCTSLVVAAASTSYCLAPPRRPRAMRIAALRLRVCCEAAKQQRQASAAAKGEAAPPKPHPRFSRSDLKRIKQQGPSVADLYAHFEVDGRDSEGKPAKITYDFVPPQVGGASAFLHDYAGGGGPGAIHVGKREAEALGSPAMYGYNQERQYWEQGWVRLGAGDAAAQQQQRRQQGRQPAAAAAGAARQRGAGAGEAAYSCPADRLLDVSFHMTRQEPSLHAFWEGLPSALFYAFGLSFLGVALLVGIFRPRKQMPIDMFQAMEFAQSKGNARRDGSTGVGFADVGGLGAAIKEMQEVVDFLRDPKRFAGVQAKPPKGILLEGDPGVGKTLIAKAIAGEAGVPFYQMAGSEFVEAIVGVGAARVRDLFDRARVNAPALIFVDEIDALGIRRADAGVRCVACIHARRHALEADVDLDQLAKDLPGLSGAEMANVLNEAALEAVRHRHERISQSDIDGGVDRVLQARALGRGAAGGIRRPGLPDDFAVRRYMAAHECGTAIVASLLHAAHGRVEAVERVSMVPRGKDWSRTIYARGRDEDYLITTRGQLLDRIRVVLAGRAAEEVALRVPSTYGVADLRDATRLAVRLVSNYGLSGLGITPYAPVPSGLGYMQAGGKRVWGWRSFEVTVDNIDADLFGNTIRGGGFQAGDAAWHRVREEAHSLLKAAYADNLRELSARRGALQARARRGEEEARGGGVLAACEAILQKETITGKELEAIIAAHPPSPDAGGGDGSGGGGGNGSRAGGSGGAAAAAAAGEPVGV